MSSRSTTDPSGPSKTSHASSRSIPCSASPSTLMTCSGANSVKRSQHLRSSEPCLQAFAAHLTRVPRRAEPCRDEQVSKDDRLLSGACAVLTSSPTLASDSAASAHTASSVNFPPAIASRTHTDAPQIDTGRIECGRAGGVVSAARSPRAPAPLRSSWPFGTSSTSSLS
eukprot:3090957-Rhodomonas_salina.1